VAEIKTRMSQGRRRPVAGREQILAAARAIGVRKGWKAVTIRAVAQKLRYTSPILYEHFRNKEDILTQLAIEGHTSFEQELGRDLPKDRDAAILTMVERYWTFMLKNTQIYRLINGMDGVSIDREMVNRRAQGIYRVTAVVVQEWLDKENAGTTTVDGLVDELWALLHGMASLQMDRSAPFDLQRAQESTLKLLVGTKILRQTQSRSGISS
jgi:AcrR family transcriptional regulator